MGWKNLASWLKGGIIGILIIYGLALIYSIFNSSSSIPEICDFQGRFIGLQIGVCLLSVIFTPLILMTAGIFFVIPGLILAVLIGWIVGKVRKNK